MEGHVTFVAALGARRIRDEPRGPQVRLGEQYPAGILRSIIVRMRLREAWVSCRLAQSVPSRSKR